ncbi:hypothetical protein KR093_005184, partial [Drosophila rubida]
NCRQCHKPVYKMEEIIVQFKADKGVYHKSCMKCKDCSKQLKFDNYQSHEGNLYCMMHLKLLLAPKVVENVDEPKILKTEVIIRESQPTELPPDVVRASDKPDLGLDELHQLNVRSRFQVFENVHQNKLEEQNHQQQNKGTVDKLRNSVLKRFRENENNSHDNDDDTDNEDTENDAELMLSKKCTQKERPIGIGDVMNDIKTRFENGHVQSKEERREERKQEIQNIRSRLFLGKQAKIKEMYQQAVAESEQVITSVGKKPDVDMCLMNTCSIKNQFENGEIFSEKSQEFTSKSNIDEDADVFASGIGKKSRSIFMELDANITLNTNASKDLHRSQSLTIGKTLSRKQIGPEISNIDVIKCGTQEENVKIPTAELSQKFKFFETYGDNEKVLQFRTTPPREVAKLSASNYEADHIDHSQKLIFHDNVLQKTQTTSNMLNKFREMELEKCKRPQLLQPRPLKCFTPPPSNDGHHDISSEEDEVEEESDDYERDEAMPINTKNDVALIEAKNAARAKQLRAKFEKWQDNEIKRELNEGYVDIYSQQVSDDSTIESAK